MPTPATRTPVRIARGTYSNLNSSIADLQEGEVCYATDQNKVYVVESATLVESPSPDLTGDITSVGNATSIASGVIVNADVNASAAIAGTKISPDFGSQTIATTGVFSHALGAAATPSLTFTGDLNTGIYSPGADQVAVATNGTQRLSIDASGNVAVDTNTLYVDAVNNRVAIGTTSPGAKLDVSGTVNFKPAAGYNALFQQSGTGLRINYVDDAGSANVSALYRATDFAWQKGDGAAVVNIDSSGRLGIGDIAPDSILTVTGGAVRSKNVTGDAGFDFHENGSAALIRQRNNRPLLFYTNNAEVARIDSSGRLLVGTSTSVNTFSVAPVFQIAGGEAYQSNIAYRADAFAPFISVGHSRSATIGTQTILQSGDDFGSFAFVGSDGTGFIQGARITAAVDGTPGTNDMPGRLVFSTTADGAASPTERMRINSAGNIITTGTFVDPAITGTILEDIFTITDGAAFEVDPGNGSIQLITLGASRTPKCTNFVAGESVTLTVDDGTAYTITWTDATWGTGGVVWKTNAGAAPTLNTSGYTVIVLWKVSTQVYGARVGDA